VKAFLTEVFLFLIVGSAIGAVVEIISMEPTDRYDVFSLKTDNPETEVTLDCSSFIHNLDIKSPDLDVIFYLYEHECWGIYNYLDLLKERRCLYYEEDYFELNDCSIYE
jgi:hypothetical protein